MMLLWKLLFIIAYIFMLLASIGLGFEVVEYLTFVDRIDLVLSFLVLLPLYGLAFSRTFYLRPFWKCFFYLSVVENIIFLVVLPVSGIERYGVVTEFDYFFVSEVVLAGLILLAVYNYSFRADGIWSNEKITCTLQGYVKGTCNWVLMSLLVVFLATYTFKWSIYPSEDPLIQEYLKERDSVVKLQLLEEVMSQSEDQRFSWLDNAAELAFDNGDYEKAKRYAEESLDMSAGYQSNWNYGNAIHNSNSVLGRVSLNEGKVEEAKQYLVESSKSKGSPQLDTFGPDVDLANDLLHLGEREVVVSYLTSVSAFWDMDNGCVSRWLDVIEKDGFPKICKCSC